MHAIKPYKRYGPDNNLIHRIRFDEERRGQVTEKLKELAKLKPGVWREMKRREYEARSYETAVETGQIKREKEQRSKRKRVKERQSLRQRHMLDHIDDFSC